jgi:2'-5' RNA ligase
VGRPLASQAAERIAKRHRLTVSLVVEGEVAREIDGMRRALGAAALTRIPPHLTLVPPVNVRDDDLDEAVEIVRLVGQESRPVRLELGPPATFWPRNPVVYLSVGGDIPAVEALRERLLTGPLSRQDDRPFVPHVTLDQRIEPERIPAALEAMADYREWVTVERVTTLRFSEAEARWAPLAIATLGRPRVVGTGGLEVELSIGPMLDPAGERFRKLEWTRYELETYGVASSDEPFAVTARVASELAGVASGQLRADYCRLGYLIVASHWRGYGVGSHLLRAVEDMARERRSPAVRLETRAGGVAEAWYRDRGYVTIGLLPRWRGGLDFAAMERVL